jgi:hypothetical protein
MAATEAFGSAEEGLERADHHGEVGDQAVGVPGDHVDALDLQPAEDSVELQHRVVLALPSIGVAQLRAKYDDGGAEVGADDVATLLRGVHSRGLEDCVVGDHCRKSGRVT